MTKIVHLTSVHYVKDTRIFHHECKALHKLGYEVVLIAQNERDEVIDGVQVIGLPRPTSRIQRFTKILPALLRKALRQNAALYHFHDSELMPVAVLLRLAGKKVVYDVHEDLYEQIQSKYWIPMPLRKPIAALARGVEKLLVATFNGVVAATPQIKTIFPARKTVLVCNFPAVDEYQSQPGAPYLERPMLLTYVGVMGVKRGIRELVQMMGQLPASLPAKLALAGRINPASMLQEIQQLPGWARCEFRGWLEQADVQKLLGEARIGLVTLYPTRAYIMSYPTKLFEYLMAGIPVIASDFPMCREIIEAAQCGILVDPLKLDEIQHAVEYLLTHPEEAQAMGERGKAIVLERYNWQHEVTTLAALYDRILG